MTSTNPPHESDEPKPAAEPSTEDTAAKKTDRSTTWIAVGIVAVIALCGVGLAVRGNRPDPNAKDRDAKRVCQDFVKKRLKAPATAEFSGLLVDVADPEYTVTGDVDAENSFGANLRAHFTCTVRDAGDQWSLVSVTGLN